jgi:hypothetical protein
MVASMTPFVFDSLSASKQLREAGMAEGVAEAVVSVFQHASAMPDISHLATKDQVDALRTDVAKMATKDELHALKASLNRHEMATKEQLRALGADLDTVRREMATKADMADMTKKMDLDIFKAATKADFAELRVEIANVRAELVDKIRQQTWMLLGGVGVLVTILNGLMKMLG